MNRGFRIKYMRLTALLLSASVIVSSMDINMLYVQAQEENAYIENTTVIEDDTADMADQSDDKDQQNDIGAEKEMVEGQQEDTGAGNDASLSGDAAANDDGDNKKDEADADDSTGTGDDGSEFGDDEKSDVDKASDGNVSDPSASVKVRPLSDEEQGSASKKTAEVMISGIAIADKVYDGDPSFCTGETIVTAKTGENGAEENVKPEVNIKYIIAGTSADGTSYKKESETFNADMPANAGIYTLKVEVTDRGSNANYIYKGSREYPFRITKRTVTVRADDKTIKINDKLPVEYSYIYSGFEDGNDGTDISGGNAGGRFQIPPKVTCSYKAGEENKDNVDNENDGGDGDNKNIHIPGQYSITVGGADAGPNYSIVYQSGTLTILDKELALISGFSIADKVYDGDPIKCEVPEITGGGKPIDYEYSIYGIMENNEEYRRSGRTAEGSTSAGIKDDMPADAGRYKVKIKVPSDNDAYKGNWQYDFEITRKKITITADDILVKRDDNASLPKLTYKAEGFVNGEDPFKEDTSAGDSAVAGKPREPKLTCSAKDRSTPGQYEIVPSGAFAGANYSIEYISGTLTISGDEAITLSGIRMSDGKNNKIYDGKPIEFELAPEVQKDGTLIPESELEFRYSISGTLADEDGTDYNSSGDMADPANRPKDAGQYILEVRVFQIIKSPAGDGSDASGSGSESVSKKEIYRQDYPFTITPRPVSVTVKDIEITAGDALPAPTEDEEWYEVGGMGFLDGDGFVTKPEFVCDLEDTESPGTYPITASKADAGFNYTIAYTAGKLTVTEREVVKTRKLVRIIPLNPVVNIKNGTPLDQIELPEMVYIKTKGISDPDTSSTEAVSEEWTHHVGVEWVRRPADGTSYSPGIKTEQRFILHGMVELPADVDAGGVSTTAAIEVFVREEITSREQVKNPTASIPTGTAVRRGTKVTLSCETEGAEIYYTLDDKNPPTKEMGLRYTYPIEVSKYTVIWACAYKDGCQESEIVKFSYYINSSLVGPGEDDDPDEPEVPEEDIPSDGRIPSGMWVTENAVADYAYTGKAIRPVVRVYDHKTLLVEKKDYTISYKNNVNAADKGDPLKPPTITITGKGNYTGKLIRKFTIKPKNIGDSDVSVDDIALAYNAKKPKAQKPSPTVMWNGKKLTNKKDYTVPDVSYTDVGTRTITVTGRGNYTGEKTFDFTITDGIPVSELTVSKIPNQVYTGKAIEPKPEVRYKGELLNLNQNYTLDWDNNTDVGTAAVIIKGIGGKYVGTRKVTFRITAAASLSKAKVELETASKPYTGQEVRVGIKSVTLKVDGADRSLKQGDDYDITYQNNVKAGTASVTLIGKGAYDGKIKKTFKVTPVNIGSQNEVRISLSASYNYVKGGTKPEPKVTFNNKTLKLGTDYTLSYKQNNAAGNIATVTVKGKGNFGGSASRTFTVTPQDIGEKLSEDDYKITVDASDKFYQNKKNIYKTTVRLTDSNGKALSAGRDYDKEMKYTYVMDVKDADGKVLWTKGTEVSKEDIIPAGTVIQVEINAKGGNYTGSVTGTYRIVASNISKAKVTIPPQSYTKKEIRPDSQIDVRVDGLKLSLGKDYEIVGYSNNIKKGTARVVIHGLGDYGGTKTVSFKIVSKALADQ